MLFTLLGKEKTLQKGTIIMNELILTENNFNENVKNADMPVLIDFWATWCGPCQMMAPIVSEIAESYGDRLIVGKVDIDENLELAKSYKVRSIPTFVIFVNGEEKARKIGALSRDEMVAWIEANL